MFLVSVSPRTREVSNERFMTSKSGAWGWIFAGLTAASQLAAYCLEHQAMFAQVFLIPELFIAFTYGSAMWLITTMNIGLVAISIAQAWPPTTVTVMNAIAQSGGSILFSAMIGGAIDQIVQVSNHNQHLVTQLLDQQGQIRALSHDEGIMAERQRVAGEVHDTLAQSLASMLALGRTAREEAQSGELENLDAHLSMITMMAQEGLDDARQLVAAGMPTSLRGGRGPHDSVHRTVRRFFEQTGIDATIDCDDDGTLAIGDQQLQVVILRITQESLANIRGHAFAHNVEVTVMRMRDEPEDDRIVVTITDDGAGFDVDAQERERHDGCRAPGHGYGLTDMRRRVDRFGGTLRIDSAPGSGTTVQASLPVLGSNAASDDDGIMRGARSEVATSGTIQVATSNATSGVAIDEVLHGRGSR